MDSPGTGWGGCGVVIREVGGYGGENLVVLDG